MWWFIYIEDQALYMICTKMYTYLVNRKEVRTHLYQNCPFEHFSIYSRDLRQCSDQRKCQHFRRSCTSTVLTLRGRAKDEAVSKTGQFK